MRGLDAICGVNPRRDSACKYSANVSKKPFRRVKSHDHSAPKPVETNLNQRLGHAAALVKVLVVGPRQPLPTALHAQRSCVAVLGDALLELLDYGYRGMRRRVIRVQGYLHREFLFKCNDGTAGAVS